jgi:hypothetical protein
MFLHRTYGEIDSNEDPQVATKKKHTNGKTQPP